MYILYKQCVDFYIRTRMIIHVLEYIYILYRAIRARLDPPEWMHLSNAKIIANFPRIYGTLYRDFCYTFTHKLYTGDFQAYQKFCM